MGVHGGSRGQRRATKVKARRQRVAEQEVQRELHARLVAERAGDPRFVQRHVGRGGFVSLAWEPDTQAGREMRAAMQGQLEAFRQKFGREPGPQDPIFFDPEAEAPVPMSVDRMAALFDELIEHAEQAGVDPAMLKASRDLGYIVTTENQHLFSFAEVQAWRDTVEHYWSQEDDAEFGGDDTGLDDLMDLLADELETIIEHTLAQRSPEPARTFATRVVDTDLGVAENSDEESPALTMAFLVLARWLASVRDEQTDPDLAEKVLAWIRTGLGPQCARLADTAVGILGLQAHRDLTVQYLADELKDDFLPALVWLSAGAVAEYGKGDVAWLRQHDGDDTSGGIVNS